MFYNCSNLKYLDLKSFNTTNCKNFKEIFEGCINLTIIINKLDDNYNLINNTPEYVNKHILNYK